MDIDWEGRKILVTGGAGMIGSSLVERLIKKGAIVSVADNLWRGKLGNLIDNGKYLIDMENDFFQRDLTRYENCIEAVSGKDVVYHLADVVAGINYVFGNQLSLFHENVLINTNTLHASIASGVKKFIYVGTACSYPYDKQNKLNMPLLKETDVYPANPESSYGWSKLMGEYECELAHKEGVIDVGILRLHNVYGPKCEMSHEKSQVIPALIRKSLNYPNERFVVWGSGRQKRAFVFLDDIVDALFSVLERGMGKGVIQIGPDNSTSIKEIAEEIVKISGKNITIEYDTSKIEGDIDRAADWSKAKEFLNWEPKTSIADGLNKTFNWCESILRS